MKKAVKTIGISFAIFVVIVLVSMIFSGDAQEAAQDGMNRAKTTLEKTE